MMVIKVVVMSKKDDQVPQLGKEERKTKTRLIKAKVSNRFLFLALKTP
jgi:hypothetical protein